MRYTRVCVDSLESMPEIMSIYKYRLLVINRAGRSISSMVSKGGRFRRTVVREASVCVDLLVRLCR